MGATDVPNVANATAMRTAACGTVDDTTAADADDGAAATNAARSAAWYDASAIGKHDDAAAALRRAESVRTDLLTGRGGFHSK